MAYGGGDTGLAAVVECNHAAVAERELELALALLACDAACHRAVHLIGKPVLAGHGLELEHLFEVFLEVGLAVRGVGIFARHGFVAHNGFWGIAEHVGHGQVYGAHAVFLFEDEAGVIRGFAHYIERCLFAFGYLSDFVNMFLIHHEAHAFLALVADDFFCREGGVAHRECGDVDFTACAFHEFREGV